MLKCLSISLFILLGATPALAKPSASELQILKARVQAVNVVFAQMKTAKGFLKMAQQLDPQHPLYKKLSAHVKDFALPKFSVNEKDGFINIEGLPHPLLVKGHKVTYLGKTISLKNKTLERQTVAMIQLIWPKAKASSAGVFSLLPAAHAREPSDWYKRHLRRFGVRDDDLDRNSDMKFLAGEGSSLMESAAGIVAGGLIAVSGVGIVAATGASGAGAVVGGAIAAAGAGIVLITLATNSASAATPEQILCTEPLGSFEVKGVSNGQSISASVNVDATKRPMSISLSGQGKSLNCPIRPKTVVNEGWIWNSEEVVWETRCSSPDASISSASMASLKTISETCTNVGASIMNTAMDTLVNKDSADAPASPGSAVQ